VSSCRRGGGSVGGWLGGLRWRRPLGHRLERTCREGAVSLQPSCAPGSKNRVIRRPTSPGRSGWMSLLRTAVWHAAPGVGAQAGNGPANAMVVLRPAASDTGLCCDDATRHGGPSMSTVAPERGWPQGIKASLGRVFVTVSSSRGFVEGVHEHGRSRTGHYACSRRVRVEITPNGTVGLLTTLSYLLPGPLSHFHAG
jgi:hypothetical protein